MIERLAYRVAEAADAVGVSRTKAYGLIADGTWPVIRVGKSVRIPVAALNEWVRQQTQRQGTGTAGE